MEDDHRDHCTRAESETLCAHFLIVDGEYSSENVVGITHYESVAFFDEAINDISGGWNLAATVPPQDRLPQLKERVSCVELRRAQAESG